MKREIERRLSFLDMAVLRLDQSLSIKAYRKSMKSNTVILFKSHHPFKYKISAFSLFIKLDFSDGL